MQNYLTELQNLFQENANPLRAQQQASYMKHQFVYYGLTSPQRRELQKPFFHKHVLPHKKEAFLIVKELWQMPQRELHYFAQELTFTYKNKTTIEDIELFEWMLSNNSWWDTVDYIGANIIGNYFMKFPEQRKIILNKWLFSNNIWLQRTCLIFQLKYKTETDTIMLSHCIENLLGTKEFFINKAIGWALRQYSRTNPIWVENFVENHPELANLSKKEALRLIQ